MTTEEDIAEDLMEYISNHQAVCARVGGAGLVWIRYSDGDWQQASYASGRGDRLSDYVRGKTLDRSEVVSKFTSNPVRLTPQDEAILLTGDNSVWDDAAEQDVFTNRDRCFWCGKSDRTRDLTLYETVEDGECYLCPDCSQSWYDAGEIVSRIGQTTA